MYHASQRFPIIYVTDYKAPYINSHARLGTSRRVSGSFLLEAASESVWWAATYYAACCDHEKPM